MLLPGEIPQICPRRRRQIPVIISSVRIVGVGSIRLQQNDIFPDVRI